jgi:hypothetical protein
MRVPHVCCPYPQAIIHAMRKDESVSLSRKSSWQSNVAKRVPAYYDSRRPSSTFIAYALYLHLYTVPTCGPDGDGAMKNCRIASIQRRPSGFLRMDISRVRSSDFRDSKGMSRAQLIKILLLKAPQRHSYFSLGAAPASSDSKAIHMRSRLGVDAEVHLIS